MTLFWLEKIRAARLRADFARGVGGGGACACRLRLGRAAAARAKPAVEPEPGWRQRRPSIRSEARLIEAFGGEYSRAGDQALSRRRADPPRQRRAIRRPSPIASRCSIRRSSTPSRCPPATFSSRAVCWLSPTTGPRSPPSWRTKSPTSPPITPPSAPNSNGARRCSSASRPRCSTSRRWAKSRRRA